MIEPVVWYLAHPVAPDERFSLQENLDHTVEVLRILFETGVYAVAPWHTMLLGIPDSPENRELGLAIDVAVVRKLGRIILTGHKVSSGMKVEIESLPSGATTINLVGVADKYIPQYLWNVYGLGRNPSL